MDSNLEITGFTSKTPETPSLEEMFTEAEKTAPQGDCEVCGAKAVPVGTLQNMDNPDITKKVCFRCLRGANNPMSEAQKN